MGRKKAAGNTNQQASRPFCFFCDRTFDDETILIQHQRAKHFRCPECDDTAVRGKCESVQGLIVHTLKVHSKSLARVPNALQGRDNPELNVYGMDGIPADILRARGIDHHAPVGKAAPPPAAASNAPLPASLEALHGLPQGMPPLPGLASIPGMPPVPELSSVGAAPSLEGFQRFLAAQQLASPPGLLPGLQPGQNGFAGSLPDGLPQLASMVGSSDALGNSSFLSAATRRPAAQSTANPGGGQPPAAMPTLSPGGGNGSPPPLLPQKRRLEPEEACEDVSVEERRALLDRYHIPR